MKDEVVQRELEELRAKKEILELRERKLADEMTRVLSELNGIDQAIGVRLQRLYGITVELKPRDPSQSIVANSSPLERPPVSHSLVPEIQAYQEVAWTPAVPGYVSPWQVVDRLVGGAPFRSYRRPAITPGTRRGRPGASLAPSRGPGAGSRRHE